MIDLDEATSEQESGGLRARSHKWSGAERGRERGGREREEGKEGRREGQGDEGRWREGKRGDKSKR